MAELDRAENCRLAEFWAMSPARREAVLLEAIAAAHTWHHARNRAYRQTMAARGVGPTLPPGACPAALLARLLRPTAQTFKSYIDVLGTPFPQDRPHDFVAWLADQLSVELPPERLARFRRHYGSLEGLLRAIERAYGDLGLEVLTSSGTSGRSTIMVRDRQGTARTAESFFLAFERYLGSLAVDRAVFIMPRQTRIAMARMASFSVAHVGLPPERVHFAIPFPALPDHVRVRTGRTWREGWRGSMERRVWHPLMTVLQDRYVFPQAIQTTVRLLERAEARGERVLLFGGWVQLHAVARALRQAGRTLRLAAGSLLGSGGGLKERYPFTPAQIREEVAQALGLTVRDVYGMAEGNWAAMQCRQGSYHIPPWVYARTLDGDDRLQEAEDSTGLLAFFDPFGGGQLFPAFFRTADRVRLIRGSCCPCGDAGDYITADSIQRVDLLDEAGCAAQV